MLEHRRALARSRVGGLPHRISAPQDRPHFGCQPKLLQTPGQALSDPVRMSPGSATRNRDQHRATAEGQCEASVTYRFQPHLRGEPWHPSTICGLQICAQQAAFLADSPAATG